MSSWLRLIDELTHAATPEALEQALVDGLVRHADADEACLVAVGCGRDGARVAARSRRGHAEPGDLAGDEMAALTRAALEPGERVRVRTEADGQGHVVAATDPRGHGGSLQCRFARPLAEHDLEGLTTAAAVFETVAAMLRSRDHERRRDGWTAQVAHDLRQPLVALRLHADEIAGTDPHLAAQIERSVAALARMAADLGDGVAAELGHLALDRVETDLGQLLSSALERIPGVPGRRITFAVESVLPRCWVDTIRIEQVVGNLIGNALKYGDPGTPIDVRLYPRPGGVLVSVASTGQPIPPAERPRLFHRFYRPASVRGRLPGLGLGLYICKEIVTGHGGRIWMQATSPRGTTFCFTLPALGRRAPARAATGS